MLNQTCKTNQSRKLANVCRLSEWTSDRMTIRSDGHPTGWPFDRKAIRPNGHSTT
ncbi:hypothetical protein Hanom_Chr16g01436761 [Helianthus anomalus]